MKARIIAIEKAPRLEETGRVYRVKRPLSLGFVLSASVTASRRTARRAPHAARLLRRRPHAAHEHGGHNREYSVQCRTQLPTHTKAPTQRTLRHAPAEAGGRRLARSLLQDLPSACDTLRVCALARARRLHGCRPAGGDWQRVEVRYNSKSVGCECLPLSLRLATPNLPPLLSHNAPSADVYMPRVGLFFASAAALEALASPPRPVPSLTTAAGGGAQLARRARREGAADSDAPAKAECVADSMVWCEVEERERVFLKP